MVQLVDKRISFGQVPLNLSTTRTARIRNSGAYHAYFQVSPTKLKSHERDLFYVSWLVPLPRIIRE